MGGTGFVSAADDVLGISVVRGVKCVGEINGYVFGSGRGSRCRGDWVNVLGLGFTYPVGTGGELGLVQGFGEWSGIIYVCVVSLDYLC